MNNPTQNQKPNPLEAHLIKWYGAFELQGKLLERAGLGEVLDNATQNIMLDQAELCAAYAQTIATMLKLMLANETALAEQKAILERVQKQIEDVLK